MFTCGLSIGHERQGPQYRLEINILGNESVQLLTDKGFYLCCCDLCAHSDELLEQVIVLIRLSGGLMLICSDSRDSSPFRLLTHSTLPWYLPYTTSCLHL